VFLLAGLVLQCEDIPTQTGEKPLTRLYLNADNTLSTSPRIGFSPIQHTYDSADYTAVLAGDMVGTECTFGLVFAARPVEKMVAKAEIIVCKEGIETVIASKHFDVNSRTYSRYSETIKIADPDCSCDNVLILRISKVSDGSAPLSIRVDGVEPFNSYIEVPSVKIMKQN
jgi:hypothetical protein